MLPTDSKTRKSTPITTGVLDYFPDAIAAVARVSKAGNDKHNPGQPMHWSRDKSTDHLDCIGRHLTEHGHFDPETGELHDAALAWRALANLQVTIEAMRAQASHTVVKSTTPQAPIQVGWGVPVRAEEVNKPAAVSSFTATAYDRTMSQKHMDRAAEAFNAAVQSFTATPIQYKNPFTYFYLATPYTKFPAGHEAAFQMAARLTARLMLNGVKVFSPIAHSHPIARFMAPERVTDHDMWMAMDEPLMNAASGMIVVTAESWEASKGMQEEIKRFTAAGKPVIYWAPDCAIPQQILKHVEIAG